MIHSNLFRCGCVVFVVWERGQKAKCYFILFCLFNVFVIYLLSAGIGWMDEDEGEDETWLVTHTSNQVISNVQSVCQPLFLFLSNFIYFIFHWNRNILLLVFLGYLNPTINLFIKHSSKSAEPIQCKNRYLWLGQSSATAAVRWMVGSEHVYFEFILIIVNKAKWQRVLFIRCPSVSKRIK